MIAVPRHLAPLWMLKSLVLGPQDEVVMGIDAQFMDELQDVVRTVEKEIFPDSTSLAGLARWESLLGLAGTGTEPERRASVIAALRAEGGLSRPFFHALAAQLGYSVEITNCPKPFRVGLSAVGEAIVDVNPDALPTPPGWDVRIKGPYCPELFVWSVTVLSGFGEPEFHLLRSMVEMLKPAWSMIRWRIDLKEFVWDGGVGVIDPGEYAFDAAMPFPAGPGIGQYPDGGVGPINAQEFTFADGTFADSQAQGTSWPS